MSTLRIDLETYSDVDLKKCGVHRYVESPAFEILLLAFAFDDEPVSVVDLARGEAIGRRVLDALVSPDVTKTAFNAQFEMACLGRHLSRATGTLGTPITIAPEQWRCTSVHALYLGLPGNLADVGRVLGLVQPKLEQGWSLIRYFCLPCKPTASNGGRTRNRPEHDEAKWLQFKAYCAGDVVAEREIAQRLDRLPIPPQERRLWALDQRMMNRGIGVDTALIDAAIECDEDQRSRITTEAIELTGLDNPNSRDQLLQWLQDQDSDIESLTAKSIPVLAANTDSAIGRRVLELRQMLAKTSVSKYAAMRRTTCVDGRTRGLTQFYGANRTGRWAGRLVQVQNLPQNRLPDLDLARTLVKARRFDDLEMLFGNVPETLSQLIRTAFVAAPGHRFLIVDFSAIEARVIAWLANCAWRLEVFATHGMIYEASAEQMFRLAPGSVTRKSPYRQKGKIAELALGYQGGVAALKTMGALEMGLTEAELEPIKTAWRAANPEIVKFWGAAQSAALAAVANRASERLPVGMHAGSSASCLVFTCERGLLQIELPSGRRLSYVKPQIAKEDLVKTDPNGRQYTAISAGALTYEGVDTQSKQWGRQATYGGKLVENITQAIARDCLANAMLALDAAGYQQLITVHDEIVIEMPERQGSVDEVCEILARPLPWAPGLVLRADGFESPYYCKEIQ